MLDYRPRIEVDSVTANQLSTGKVVLQRWAVAVTVVAAVLLAFGFNSRLTAIRQMRQDEARLKQAVATEETRQASLKSYLDYIRSESYVEHWARVDARMVKAGEVAVIPVAPTTGQLGSDSPAPAEVPATILDEWWALFFGEPSTP
jgi:cell division protein FtsB